MTHSHSNAILVFIIAISTGARVCAVSAGKGAEDAGFVCAISSTSDRSGAPALKTADKIPSLTDPDVFHESGVRKVNAGDLEGALADFTTAITLDPKNIAGYNNRAHVRVMQRKPDAAIADYSRAIALKPEDSTAYSGRSTAKVMNGDLKGALADSDKAVALAPDDAEIRNARGGVRYLTGDLKAALADYDRALELDPKLVGALENRSKARNLTGDIAGELADLDAAISLGSTDADIHTNRASVRLKKGDVDGALADSSSAIELEPKNPAGHRIRGEAKRAKGDFDGAISDLNRAIELEPKNASAYFSRGKARYLTRAFGRAAADFEAAARADKTIETSTILLSSVARTRSGDNPAEDKKLQAWIDKRGSGKSAGWPSAVGRFLLGKDDEAALLSGAAAFAKKKESGQLGQAWYFAGIRCLATGDKQGAAERFRKCADADHNESVVRAFAEAELKWLGEK